MEVMPDHVHVLIDAKPQFYISDMVKIMKGTLARRLFLLHPEMKEKLWGGHLWNPSYCVVTVSDRSREQVEEVYQEPEGKGLGREGTSAAGSGKAPEIPQGSARCRSCSAPERRCRKAAAP